MLPLTKAEGEVAPLRRGGDERRWQGRPPAGSEGRRGASSPSDSEQGAEPLLLPPFTHPVVDRLGADDAFMAGLIYGFLDGSDFTESARFAGGCAALSRASESINNPTLSVDNVLSLLESQP